jgi:hypothetical protein
MTGSTLRAKAWATAAFRLLAHCLSLGEIGPIAQGSALRLLPRQISADLAKRGVKLSHVSVAASWPASEAWPHDGQQIARPRSLSG